MEREAERLRTQTVTCSPSPMYSRPAASTSSDDVAAVSPSSEWMSFRSLPNTTTCKTKNDAASEVSQRSVHTRTHRHSHTHAHTAYAIGRKTTRLTSPPAPESYATRFLRLALRSTEPKQKTSTVHKEAERFHLAVIAHEHVGVGQAHIVRRRLNRRVARIIRSRAR